jgi:hypothetical protein
VKVHFSPDNFNLFKKDFKLGLKVSSIPLFSTLSLEKLELKVKNLIPKEDRNGRLRFSASSLDTSMHISVTSNLLYGLHMTQKVGQLYFQ